MERLHVREEEADAAVLFAFSVDLLGVCPTHAHVVNLEKRAHLTTHPLFKALCGARTLERIL